jgi:hypothetical protein
MRNYKKHMITLLSIIMVMLFPLLTFAQGGPGDPGGGGDPGVPFDGGASILIASGVAYGAKKYKERKSRKSGESGEFESL